jgi:hypothetical protein
MPTTTLPTTQYTEENYSELYVNLPAGLKDLVLSGRLAILVSGVGVKNGLDADQVGELEPAVEDVCLGLITQKELPQNIVTQTGMDISLARKIAGDVLTEILEPFSQDINFARQFKLEMDERLSSAKNKTDIAGLPDASSLRAQILSENKAKIGSDQKVAAFFSKKPEDEIEEMETENFSNNSKYYGEEEDEEEKIKNDLGASNFIQKEVEEEFPKNIIPNNNLSFSQIVNKTSSTKTDSATDNAAMVRFEQELATLTQAINSLVKNTPTGKDFNLKSFEEISSQIEKIQKEISEIKINQDEINKKIKALETGSLINNSVQNKTEVQAIPKKEEVKPFVFTSAVTKEAAEAIATSPSTKKVLSFEELTGTKGNTETNKSSEVFSSTKKGADFFKILEGDDAIKNEEAKKEEEFKADKEEKKKMLSSVLLKDLQNLKTANIITPVSGIQTDINQTLESTSKDAVSGLKDELLPQSREDRMKALQEKIKNLNQGKI